MKIGIATYCKGRLEHLKEIAPYLEQVKKKSKHDVQVHVLDYDCPEGTKEWIEGNTSFACTKIQADGYNYPRARNLSAKYFVDKNIDYIFILDCDVKLTDPLVIDKAIKKDNNSFFCGRTIGTDYGNCLMSLKAFVEMKGYNESYKYGWGYYDYDFYTRLLFAGYNEQSIEGLEPIKHEHTEDINYQNYLNSQVSTFNSIFAEPIHVVTFYEVKRDLHLKELHQQITKNLGYDVIYVPTKQCHGDVITNYMHVTNYAKYLIIDLDCFPLIPYNEMIDVFQKINKPLIGGAQKANYINNSTDYIGVYFHYIEKEEWIRAGMPSYAGTSRDDVGGTVFRAIKDKHSLYAKEQDNQPDVLEDGSRYGDRNTYLYEGKGIFYHHWGVRFPENHQSFIELCKSMIQKKPL